jgi:hypothetical protein
VSAGVCHETGAGMRLCAILVEDQTAILLNNQTAILLNDQNGIFAILNC